MCKSTFLQYRVFALYDVTGDWDSMVQKNVKDREDWTTNQDRFL